MPGKHSAKQKRQAKHIAASERARGKSPEEAERIGWATVNARKADGLPGGEAYAAMGKAAMTWHHAPGGTYSGDPGVGGGTAESRRPGVPHGSYEVHSKPKMFGTGKKHQLMYYPFEAPHGKPRHEQKLSTHRTLDEAHQAAEAHHAKKMSKVNKAGVGGEDDASGPVIAKPWKMPRGIDPHGQRTRASREYAPSYRHQIARETEPKIPEILSISHRAKLHRAVKSFQIMSLDDAYNLLKADGQPAAPAAPGSGPPKKFPRRDKTPNVLGKPTTKALSNPYASLIGPEAVAAGEKKDKEIDERSRTRDRAWIAANPKPKTKKALSTGYGKVSGGGALKAPNRGFPVKKGPGDFKPTPIAARTSQASQRSSAPKKPGLEIGEVTVTPMPKKPVNLEIGDVKVTPMPKKPVNLEIGPATVTSLGPPKPTQVAARKALRLSINDLNRAVTAQPSASPPPVPGSSKRPYLPGVHPVSAKPKFKRDAGSFMGMPAKKPGKSLDAQRPKTSSKKSPRALDGGGAALMGSMPPPTLTKPNTVVQKSKGTSMSKTNFNNLFKSELGIPNDEVLCACPHCDSPITKSDLVAKAGDDMVVNQNKKGGMMRGGEGRGVISPSRGVAGAHQTDEVRMVGDKSKKKLVSKGHDDDASSDGGDVDKGDGPIAGGMQTMGPKTSDAGGDKGRVSMRGVAQAQGEKPPTTQVATLTGRAQGPGTSQKPPQVATKSMPIIRGTEWVQYVDDGSDASIAKSIAEAQGQLGQQATQPMDLNNDLSRLLV